METIHHHININTSANNIYALVATKVGIQKWLRAEEGWTIKGSEELGGTILFYLHNDHHEMKMMKLEPDSLVSWQCTVGPPEWLGTRVDFLIDAKDDGCILQFTHEGWADRTAFFEECDKAWGEYVAEIKRVAER